MTHPDPIADLPEAVRDLAQAIRELSAAQQHQPPPGPARGLHTAIRNTPDHRDRNRNGRIGFAPTHAQEDQ